MSPPGAESWPRLTITGRIDGEIHTVVKEHGLGLVFAETGFLIERDPDTVPAPDCAFVSRDGDSLDDGDVLPGFRLDVVRLWG